MIFNPVILFFVTLFTVVFNKKNTVLCDTFGNTVCRNKKKTHRNVITVGDRKKRQSTQEKEKDINKQTDTKKKQAPS